MLHYIKTILHQIKTYYTVWNRDEEIVIRGKLIFITRRD